jgi:hypothetical protein
VPILLVVLLGVELLLLIGALGPWVAPLLPAGSEALVDRDELSVDGPDTDGGLLALVAVIALGLTLFAAWRGVRRWAMWLLAAILMVAGSIGIADWMAAEDLLSDDAVSASTGHEVRWGLVLATVMGCAGALIALSCAARPTLLARYTLASPFPDMTSPGATK